MNAYLDAFRRAFDFKGRSNRPVYWFFMLTYFIILVMLFIVAEAIGTLDNEGVGVLSSIAILLHLIPALSVTVRRLHDIGRSGWWILIGFVPLVGLITLIVFACLPSQPQSNQLGGNPATGPVPPMPAPAPTTQAPQTGVPLDQLEKLSALKASGAIDDEEFKAMKAYLLTKARPS